MSNTKRSIKMIWAFSIVAKVKDNKYLDENVFQNKVDTFLKSLSDYFEKENITYVLSKLEQTNLEKMCNKQCCMLCYDTGKDNSFRAIDRNYELADVVRPFLEELKQHCHYTISSGCETFINDAYVQYIVKEYETKYDVHLEEDVIGFC